MDKYRNKDSEYVYNSELETLYSTVRSEIGKRIKEFRLLWEKGTEEELFREFTFCLLTPQSKAKSCWKAVERLSGDNLLFDACRDVIANNLTGVRFHHTKAANIERARELFVRNGKFNIRTPIMRFESPFDARDWLVQNVKGFGYKEASHFMRNVGLGENFAILDRHVLRNLKRLGVIDEIPRYLKAKRYIDIEQKMRQFADDIGIPLDHLDLLLWFRETGEIFK
jgi:N-glycosylase/DNA lyase